MKTAAGVMGMMMLFIGAAAGDSESLLLPAVLCILGSVLMLNASKGGAYEEDEMEDSGNGRGDNVVDFFRDRHDE